MKHLALGLLLACGAAAAEPLRDPLLPPPSARSETPGASAPTAAPAAPSAPVPRQILVVDGRRYLVEGTRLRGVGERFGNARIERIGDDAVWLREGGRVQRVPLFAGVTRRPAAEPAAPAASAPRQDTAPALARAPRPSSTDQP